jgi:hypothetical protein
MNEVAGADIIELERPGDLTRDYFAAYANALEEFATDLEHQATRRNNRAQRLVESLPDLREAAAAMHEMAASLTNSTDASEPALTRAFAEAAGFTTVEDFRFVAYRLANYLPFKSSRATLLAYFLAVLGPRVHRRQRGRDRIWDWERRNGLEETED